VDPSFSYDTAPSASASASLQPRRCLVGISRSFSDHHMDKESAGCRTRVAAARTMWTTCSDATTRRWTRAASFRTRMDRQQAGKWTRRLQAKLDRCLTRCEQQYHSSWRTSAAPAAVADVSLSLSAAFATARAICAAVLRRAACTILTSTPMRSPPSGVVRSAYSTTDVLHAIRSTACRLPALHHDSCDASTDAVVSRLLLLGACLRWFGSETCVGHSGRHLQ